MKGDWITLPGDRLVNLDNIHSIGFTHAAGPMAASLKFYGPAAALDSDDTIRWSLDEVEGPQAEILWRQLRDKVARKEDGR